MLCRLLLLIVVVVVIIIVVLLLIRVTLCRLFVRVLLLLITLLLICVLCIVRTGIFLISSGLRVILVRFLVSVLSIISISVLICGSLCISHLNSLHVLVIGYLLCSEGGCWLLLFATTNEICVAELFFFLYRCYGLCISLLLITVVGLLLVVLILLVSLILMLIVVVLLLIISWLCLIIGLIAVVLVLLVVRVLIVVLIILLAVVLLLTLIVTLVVVVVVVSLLLGNWLHSTAHIVRVTHTLIRNYWLVDLHGCFLFCAVKVIQVEPFRRKGWSWLCTSLLSAPDIVRIGHAIVFLLGSRRVVIRIILLLAGICVVLIRCCLRLLIALSCGVWISRSG